METARPPWPRNALTIAVISRVGSRQMIAPVQHRPVGTTIETVLRPPEPAKSSGRGPRRGGRPHKEARLLRPWPGAVMTTAPGLRAGRRSEPRCMSSVSGVRKPVRFDLRQHLRPAKINRSPAAERSSAAHEHDLLVRAHVL